MRRKNNRNVVEVVEEKRYLVVVLVKVEEKQ